MPKPKPLNLPSQAALMAKFDYNPSTGKLTHKHNCRFHKAGSEAGNRTSKGYISLWAIDGYYLAHRIIWKMIYNEEPPEVDHKNRVRDDNRLDNLKASDYFQNQQNRAGARFGTVGIRKSSPGRYQARITKNNKEIYLGSFKTFEEALEARTKAAKEYHG